MEEGTTKVTKTTSKLQFFQHNGIECSYPSMYTTNITPFVLNYKSFLALLWYVYNLQFRTEGTKLRCILHPNHILFQSGRKPTS